MDRSAGKTTKVAETDPQVWGALFRQFHPIKTAENVAADLGASTRTVENWMSGVSTPSLSWFVRIVRRYGPTVLARVMPGPCDWLDAAARAERLAALQAEQARLDREMLALHGGRA